MKFTWIFYVCCLFSWGQFTWARTGHQCIATSELKELVQQFGQVREYIEDGNQFYCQRRRGVGTVGLLKALSFIQSFEPTFIDHGIKKSMRPHEMPIRVHPEVLLSESPWWIYFKKRVRAFEEVGTCDRRTAAYIKTFIRGKVYVCSKYFSQKTTPALAGTLLHEARHFDGFNHVPCRQGPFKDFEGCDRRYQDLGSYAVSTYANMQFALANQFSAAERLLYESRAVMILHNNFNEVPKLDYSQRDIYLTNQQGDIYLWQPSQGRLNLVHSLKAPGYAFATFSGVLTVYPLDPHEEAYRLRGSMRASGPEQVEDSGLFANFYNGFGVKLRDLKGVVHSDYSHRIKVSPSASFVANGRQFFHRDRPVYFRYGNVDTVLQSHDGPVVRTTSGQHFKAYLSSINKLLFEPTEVTFPSEVKNSLVYDSSIYAVLASGHVAELSYDRGGYRIEVIFGQLGRNWLNISGYTYPRLLETSTGEGE